MSTPYVCQYCNQCFTRKDSLVKHIEKKRCKWLKIGSVNIEQLKNTLDQIGDFYQGRITLKKPISIKVQKSSDNEERPVTKSDLDRLEQQIAELKGKPTNVVNNNLQIVCVGNNDNYLDMLTDQWESFDKALEYIKDCALSQLSGDCKLVEKIYLSNDKKSIRYTDKSRTKIEYLNEKKELVRDTKELFGKKIANNLQNSYLKGVNYLLNNTLNNRLCPNKFLEEYDIQTWNQHIYDLCDHHYQKKIVNHLDIPQASD